VVEIVKNHVCRAGMLGDAASTWCNPFKGWIWEHCPTEALILTTGQREVKIMPQAAPRPLKIRRRHGSTDLLTLAAQIYWLSELHIGTTQTVRLPITTYYADRAATAALDGLAWPILQTTPHLWFI
jgi:argonaute-like protein implicated in RNA metabolism and viral defense